MKDYKHTQIGYLLITALGAAVLLIAYLTIVTRFNPGAMILLSFMTLCVAAFATLTVEVDDEALEIHFGMGIFRKRFLLKNIESYRAVRNPWYYGWGIHLIPGGWIYNVSGWDAIELRMRNGRTYRIGTNDSQGLIDALAVYMQKT